MSASSTTFSPDPSQELHGVRDGSAWNLENPFNGNPYPEDTWNYDNYYDYWLNKFKGTKYYDAFLSNPYHGNDYQPSFWDSLSEAFTGNSDARRYNLSQQQASRDYISQLVQSMREEEYNSAQAQVAREQAAGLNPDLLNNVTSGSATEFDNSAENPEIPAQSDKLGNTLTYGIDTLLRSFDLASSITEKVFKMKSMQSDIDAKEISNISQLYSLGDDIVSSVNRGEYDPNISFSLSDNGLSWYGSKPWSPDEPAILNYIHLSKRNKDRLFPILSQRYHSFGNRKGSAETKKGLQEALQGVALNEASQFYSGIDDMPDVWKNTLGYLSSLLDDELSTRFQSMRNENQFNRDYFSNLSGRDLSEAENWLAEGKKQNAKMSKEMYSKQAELIGNLVKSSKNGGLEGFFSNAVLLALPFFNQIGGFSVGNGSFSGKNGSGFHKNFSVKMR